MDTYTKKPYYIHKQKFIFIFAVDNLLQGRKPPKLLCVYTKQTLSTTTSTDHVTFLLYLLLFTSNCYFCCK